MSIWVKLLMASNVWIYRLTGGALGSRMGGQNVLLLRTVGRKSGKTYITPVNYFRDGEAYILVGSNWGRDNHAAWYLNLMHQPEASIQVKRQVIPVKASAAEGPDYERLWKAVTSQNDFYSRYQAQTRRKIPLVVLKPIDHKFDTG